MENDLQNATEDFMKVLVPALYIGAVLKACGADPKKIKIHKGQTYCNVPDLNDHQLQALFRARLRTGHHLLIKRSGLGLKIIFTDPEIHSGLEMQGGVKGNESEIARSSPNL